MDILLIALLILLNGLFAMSEIAVLSARPARLQQLASDGGRGAASAMALKVESSSFLSTVQIGITMVGILSGTMGETALADPLTRWLAGIPSLAPYARGLALTLVVSLLTYCSVVAGELVPKRLGLLAPERIAAAVALPMQILARAAAPLVWFLAGSSSLLLSLLGRRAAPDAPVTDAEIRLLMAQGAEAGVFHASEQAIVGNVLRLDEQSLRAIMTPRQEIHTLDLNRPEAEIRSSLANCPHSRVVVCRDGLEHILGLLRTADLLKAALACEPLEIERHLHPPLFLWEAATTTQLIESFRKANLQCALIVDEYGEIQGMATLTDVLASIVGELPSTGDGEHRYFIEREDGSWLVDGKAPLEQLKATLKINDAFPGEEKKAYLTVGGLAIYLLGRIPSEADHFTENGFRFEIIDMDNIRVDKVLVSRFPSPGKGER